MINEQELRELGASVLHDMLVLEIRELQKTQKWSLETLAQQLGIADKSTLSASRIVKMGKANIHKLAFCKYGDVSVIARVLLNKLGVPISDFNLPIVGHLLAHGVGFVESLEHALPRLRGQARHQRAVAELLLCFTNVHFYRELAEARWEGLRSVPIYPMGKFHESDRTIELMADATPYWNVFKNSGFNGVLRFSHAVKLGNERRDALAEKMVKHAEKEPFWLHDALGEAIRFRHYPDKGRRDEVTAACAVAQAFICNEVLYGATHILRGNVKSDKALQGSALGLIAGELYKYAKERRQELRTVCVNVLEHLPDKDIRSAVAIGEHVNSMSKVTCLEGLNLGPIYLTAEAAKDIGAEPAMAKNLMGGHAPPFDEYEKYGLLPKGISSAIRARQKKGRPRKAAKKG